jgi:uncharacterized membrane protein
VRLRLSIGMLALAGAGIATYLTVTHYRHIAPICAGGGCELVQRSQWATLGPIPISVLGLAAFVAIALSVLPRARTAVFGGYAVALAGALFAAYLIAVQAGQLHAICVWCVASDSVTLALAVLAGWRALRTTA